MRSSGFFFPHTPPEDTVVDLSINIYQNISLADKSLPVPVTPVVFVCGAVQNVSTAE